MAQQTISSVLQRMTIKSSRPGRPDYPMIRTLSGWQHDGAPCEGRFFRSDRPCRHIQEAEKHMAEDTSRALVTGAVGTALQLESYASDALTQRDMVALQQASVDVIDRWCYSFNAGDGQVTGLSIKGVQAIAREMSKKGEIIKPVDIQVVAEDDEEIRVICTAVREMIRVIDGQVVRIELDRTTRGKRQPKMQEINIWDGPDGQKRKVGVRLVPDKFWFEKGVSKAVRNAMGSLMGGEMEATVISLWRQAQQQLGKTRNLPPPRPENRQLGSGQRQTQPNQQQRAAAPQAAPPEPQRDEVDAMPLTPALRQQITKKFNEVKTSLAGTEQQAFLTAFYTAYPHCRPLQGAPGGLVLGKVQTIGDGKGIVRWLNARLGLEAPPEDDAPGLQGALGDTAARDEVKEAVMEGCQHPEDAMQAHPTAENVLVCGACGEEFALTDGDGTEA